jgi:DNA repair exonuclease SbcCD nuclease subunit
MKIGLFTDSHYSDKKASSERLHSLSYEKIKEAMVYFKEQDADLVICLGDLTDDCIDVCDNPRALKDLSLMINSFGIKFYSLMGNHDCQSFSKEEFIALTDGAYPPFKIETEKSVLIFLDCNYNDNGKKYEVGKVDWTNTYLPNDQLSMLEEAIKTNKDVYIFSHQSIDSEVEENHIVHNADKIREVIKQTTTKMVIQGHFHPGHDTIIDGVKYHTLKAMCEGKENFYEILTVK